MPFIIILDSPILAWCSSFAEKLGKQLKQVGIFDVTDSPNDDLPNFRIDGTETHFVILFAEGALSVEPWRKRADLKIYLDASEVDIAAALINSLRMDASRSGRKMQPMTLSEEVGRILKEKGNVDSEEGGSSRHYADITIASDEKFDEAVVSIAGHIERIDPLTSRAFLDSGKRRKRIDQMIRQYQHATMTSRKAKIKRQLWIVVINATLVFKRIMDMVLSLIALLLLSPLLLVVAILIKIHDGGPVFYTQTRVGLHGKEFPFPKFRSMVRNADVLKDSLLQQADRAGDITFKMKHDPRITPIGRFIRRFSIDELPQLWCVLKGDMSVVGPRPPVPREVALYTQEDRRRLEVKPGLTGIWQVSGRAEIGFKQQVELDVLYIESHGFWLDLKLILKTIPAVLTGKGAY